MIDKTTCIIVDDEESSRLHLIDLLKDYPFIEVIAQAANGKEGLDLLAQNLPDLIFIDVEMPVMNGFTMLAKIKKQPKIIFTTIKDEGVIQSFKENHLDYLLKPIAKESLAQSMAKLQETYKPMASSLAQLLDKFKD